MNYATEDRIFKLAQAVTEARDKITESLNEIDLHAFECEDCKPSPHGGQPRLCGQASHLNAVLVGCIEQHAQILDEWREAKYGQEQP